MANEQYELYQQGTAAALASLITGKLNGGQTAIAPLLTAGAADGIKGGGPTVDAAFLHRVSGGGQASDGPATIKSVKGNTLVWNQLYHKNVESATIRGITYTIDANGLITLNGTVSQTGYILGYVVPVTVGHKYLACGHGGNFDGSKVTFELQVSGGVDSTNSGLILTVAAGTTQFAPAICLQNLGDTLTNVTFRPQLFDLTQMFGAGNEPSTVAEFEALYPEQYYPYDAGSLLSVQMEGVESVGKNIVTPAHVINAYFAQDVPITLNSSTRTLYAPCEPNTTYTVSKTMQYYQQERYIIGYTDEIPAAGVSVHGVIAVQISDGTQYAGQRVVRSITTGDNAKYIVFWVGLSAYDNAYSKAQIERGASATEYEPYWLQTRSITATNLRSAGTVCDELREDERITRVGVVDLGTLTWMSATQGDVIYLYADFSSAAAGTPLPTLPASNSVTPDITCVPYQTVRNILTISTNMSISLASSSARLFVHDDAYTDAAAFKAAMDGVILYYALVAPTVTPIDPPLNLSYRAEQGGTETVLVPTGEMSAPVPMVVVYGSTPDGILDRSASLLAAQDGPTATANHGVGDYLTMGGQLYRVTTAIASGEAIVPGTNVTATTVMAEVLTLIQ